jgi:hypothetical protein
MVTRISTDYPTYRPGEQWLEIRRVRNPGNLVSHTQVFSPDEPASMLFDACAAIDQIDVEV